jgi:hypothetical protein
MAQNQPSKGTTDHPDARERAETPASGPGDAPGLGPFNTLLRRMLAMPPKPHSEMKLGKPRGRGVSRRHQEGAVDKDAARG